MKERKELIVYLCLLLSYYMRAYRENRYLQVLRNTRPFRALQLKN